MQLAARDILCLSWGEIPLARLKVIIQLLPLVKWNVFDHFGNTYLKNFILKQLIRTGREPKTKLKYSTIYRRLSAEQLVDLYTHELGFLQELITAFLIPAYTLEGKTFRAPEPALGDISIERLIEADIALSRYIISGRTEYIGHFLACLYTLPGQSFDEALDTNPPILAKIPEPEVIAIIRAFMGGKKALIDANPEIFPEPDQPAKGKKAAPPKPKDPAPAWKAFLHELANTRAYPGMHYAKTANAHEALDYFNREQKKIREENQRIQSLRKK